MIYCEACRAKKRWPGGLFAGWNRCEVCEKPRQCYDESSWFVLDQEQPLGVDAYNMARKEHAFLLMCEGLKQAEVARRLGVSSTAVRQMLDKFAGKMHHVLKHCRCRIERAA